MVFGHVARSRTYPTKALSYAKRLARRLIKEVAA
jgi:hypothetical protein